MKVKLTKLKESDNPRHPNNIAEGFEIEGEFICDPKVGESFWVGTNYRTSLVQEIIDSHTFRTYNSIYKWELVE